MTIPITDLDHRIPIIDRKIDARGYSKFPIDPEHPRYNEPLILLDEMGVAYESHHARTDGENWPYNLQVPGSRKDTWLRLGLAQMLVKVNKRLEPFGAECFVLDGYRPIECQRGLWQFFYDDTRRENPNATSEECTANAARYVNNPVRFDVNDCATWPAHTTGASVDITLRSLDTGELFDMGVRFEDIAPPRAQDYFERQFESGLIPRDDRRLWNRRLLHWAMSAEGFQNDPIVFWHFDWGNQLYVMVKKLLFDDGPNAAWYGYIAAPPAS